LANQYWMNPPRASKAMPNITVSTLCFNIASFVLSIFFHIISSGYGALYMLMYSLLILYWLSSSQANNFLTYCTIVPCVRKYYLAIDLEKMIMATDALSFPLLISSCLKLSYSPLSTSILNLSSCNFLSFK
jgi:hypothetical protein